MYTVRKYVYVLLVLYGTVSIPVYMSTGIRTYVGALCLVIDIRTRKIQEEEYSRKEHLYTYVNSIQEWSPSVEE